MNIFDSYNCQVDRPRFSLELTRVPSFWNHPKTVAQFCEWQKPSEPRR
jgi:hypothetical protein